MKDVRVVEIGDRIAAGVCGSLLASIGAETILVEPREAKRDHKWANRSVVAAGKRSVSASLTEEFVVSFLSAADVVIASSDVSPIPQYPRPQGQILCDITAYGSTGPLAGVAHPDVLIQAATGLIDTTGEADKPPLPIGMPIVECIAGLAATAAIQVALRVRDHAGHGQQIEVALYDCAFWTLTPFLSFHFAGKSIQRSGNRHVLASPWDCYKAQDGWIVICTATDDQWQRLCAAMNSPALSSDACFQTTRDRIERRESVNTAVQDWVARQTLADCFRQLHSHDIACGPVVLAENLSNEPNLKHRATLAMEVDPLTGRHLLVPGGTIKVAQNPYRPSTRIPRPDEDHLQLQQSCRPAAQNASSAAATKKNPDHVLAGVKVLEIGQYTTAPLVTRELATLGADVLKIEPPSGDGSRGWSPQQHGQSYFFSASNNGKQSLCLDLRAAEDRKLFQKLVAESDVLVENLKPGSLRKLGLGPEVLPQLNPRLVYCALSGFGADSAYPERAAFDTVVQAMSGVMDLIRLDGTPQKTGISSADILSGLFGLVAVLDALAIRKSSGRGEQIDISMQDASAWLTLWRTPDENLTHHVAILPCQDGYIAAMIPKAGAPALQALLSASKTHSRAEFVTCLAEDQMEAAAVLTVNEAAESTQTRARHLLAKATDRIGREWPLINSPIRVSGARAIIGRAIGPLGEANEQISARLGRSHSSPK